MPDKFREDSLLVSLEQKIIIAFLSKGKWVKSRERGYGSEEESEKKEDTMRRLTLSSKGKHCSIETIG